MLFLSGLVMLLLFAGNLYGARYIVRYELGQQMLRIKLFGLLPVRRIKMEDIIEVKVISAWTETLPFSKGFECAFLCAERWPSYVFKKNGVFIRNKAGISRYLILSPKDPEDFTSKIRRYKAMVSGR